MAKHMWYNFHAEKESAFGPKKMNFFLQVLPLHRLRSSVNEYFFFILSMSAGWVVKRLPPVF